MLFLLWTMAMATVYTSGVLATVPFTILLLALAWVIFSLVLHWSLHLLTLRPPHFTRILPWPNINPLGGFS